MTAVTTNQGFFQKHVKIAKPTTICDHKNIRCLVRVKITIACDDTVHTEVNFTCYICYCQQPINRNKNTYEIYHFIEMKMSHFFIFSWNDKKNIYKCLIKYYASLSKKFESHSLLNFVSNTKQIWASFELLFPLKSSEILTCFSIVKKTLPNFFKLHYHAPENIKASYLWWSPF